MAHETNECSPDPNPPDMTLEEPRRFTRGRLSRGTGLRKTTGCLTCRRRHVKCDEARPQCGGCTRRKARCEYARPGEMRSRARRKAGAGERNSTDPGPASGTADSRDVSVDDAASFSPERLVPAAHGQQRTQLFESTQQPDATASYVADIPTANWIDDTIDGAIGADEPASGGYAVPRDAYCTITPPQTSVNSGVSRGTSGLQHLRPYIYEQPPAAQPSYYPDPPPYSSTPDSASGHAADSPTSKWLDLLIADATLNQRSPADFQYDFNGLDIFGNSVLQTTVLPDETNAGGSGQSGGGVPAEPTNKPGASPRNAYLGERISRTRDQQREKEEAWEASEPIDLQPQEHILFRHFVEHISKWMDLFDPQRPFGTLVPHLALHNVGLMNAILALSARHLGKMNSSTPTHASGLRPDPNDTIRYYYRTLHYSQKAMQYDSYKTSLELLASSIIISSYEMLDGPSTDWEKHLKGVFWIQRSQVIHGDSGGLRQAVWWAWICQDVWAAFREKRRPFTFWKPCRDLADMSPSELAARAVYNFAQVVGFCAEEEEGSEARCAAARASEADLLLRQLEDWKSRLTVEFDPIPVTASPGTDEIFPTMWIQPASFAVSMQLYYCSLILVHLHRPCAGGLNEYLEKQRNLKKWACFVCGIAKTSTDYASSIMSSQCVFIAGMILDNEKQCSSVLDLLDACSQRAGWPAIPLGDELKRIWQKD